MFETAIINEISELRSEISLIRERVEVLESLGWNESYREGDLGHKVVIIDTVNKDTLRLDWMEKNGVGGWIARRRTTHPGIAVHNSSIGKYLTAREAIDEAMKDDDL